METIAMTRPDLSFFDPPGGLPPPVATQRDDDPRLPPPDHTSHEDFLAELANQNEVLRYSQAMAESALERFETLFSRVPLALMVVDELDMVVQANSMAHRSFQPTEHDRPLSALMPFVTAHDTMRVRQAFIRAKDCGHSEVSEIAFVIGTDQHIVGDLHIALLESGSTDLSIATHFLCAVIDQGPVLAERYALERSANALQERNAQLHASEKRLAAVINSALDAILCVDRTGNITVFNPTAAALFHCSTSDAIGSQLARFLPNAAELLSMASITTQATFADITAITTTGMPLAVEVSVSFERNGDTETTTIFARDLTARKREEAHRQALELQLRESHKMQAVGTMAGGIAHDFNNILSAILGNVDLAKADCSPQSQALESLLEIEKAGRRARDLVRQILAFSRNEPPQRTTVHVPAIAQETEQLVRVTLPPSIGLRITMAESLPTISADATQIEQALLNLCTNAIHAIGTTGGSIEIGANTTLAGTELCSKINIKPGRYLAIWVADTGPGMSAATIERIFEPFFTTKPVGQGTGLGLAVVHGVMRTHEGAIDVQSTLGRGSQFTLYFPLAASDQLNTHTAHQPRPEGSRMQPPSSEGHTTTRTTFAPAPIQETTKTPQPPTAASPHLAQRPAHVMYVDDDEALVFLVQRLLRRQGYQVSGYSDPHAAIAALQEHADIYDLVVTDYNMPGFCGVELVRTAKQIRPQLPVALASGYITADIEAAAIAEGADALIYKPNDADELCSTVHQLIFSREPRP